MKKKTKNFIHISLVKFERLNARDENEELKYKTSLSVIVGYIRLMKLDSPFFLVQKTSPRREVQKCAKRWLNVIYTYRIAAL